MGCKKDQVVCMKRLTELASLGTNGRESSVEVIKSIVGEDYLSDIVMQAYLRWVRNGADAASEYIKAEVEKHCAQSEPEKS